MKPSERLSVYAADGQRFGYFLAGRLYEYASSTCVGFVDDNNRFISQSQIVGRMTGTQIIKHDGTTLCLVNNH